MLQEQGLAERVVVLAAQAPDAATVTGMRRLCRASWRLDEMAERYTAFLHAFGPLARRTPGLRELKPEQCFTARTLLIHEYRRILLHDPDLPDELLPAAWPGHPARDLVRELYRRIHGGAVQFLRSEMESARGPLPAPDAGYYRRLGGLRR
jgi:phenylacetic acid degradation operon negative regulatory protein